MSKESESEADATSSKKRKAEDDLRDATETSDDADTDKPAESSEDPVDKAKLEAGPQSNEGGSKKDVEGGEKEDQMEVDENGKTSEKGDEAAEGATNVNDDLVTTGDQPKETTDEKSEEKGKENGSPAPLSGETKGASEGNSKKADSGPKKNPYEQLRWTMIKNDGRPESLIKLIALKSLFAKQLPKMPRAYIARLVFDRRHISLVILSDDPKVKDTDKEVIGSICYRPFPEMRFAEIAFCAVNSDHQVKVSQNAFEYCSRPSQCLLNFIADAFFQGYGTKLMNLVKKEGARTGIEYFITYADNYAIGYFKKQGFSKTVSMPKGRYQGLIKDYDGGTMMECYVHPSVDFTRIPEMLEAQRKFILSRIRLKANSTKVYDPLPKGWSPNLEGVSRANETAARAMAIPGMVEAGWTMADLMAATGQGKDADRAKNALKNELQSIVRKVDEQQFAWPFREPVDTTEVKVRTSCVEGDSPANRRIGTHGLISCRTIWR